jgi:superfamily II DNA helicase RecQ
MYCAFLLFYYSLILCRELLIKMAKIIYGINLWARAIDKVLNVFQVPSLYKEQQEALTQLFLKRDVFVNLPKSYGKSLIFQAVLADVVFRRSTGTSIVVLISPLKALMEDQVRHLNKLGVSAACVSDQHDDRLVKDIINGQYTHVYGSPEC